ncbi:uncharacterized protein [Asterias amurensis]
MLCYQKLSWALQEISIWDTRIFSNLGRQPLNYWLWSFAIFLGARWSSLAPKLDFSNEEISNIKNSFPGQDVRQAMHMLTTWKINYVCGNIVGTLCRAARQMRRHDLLRVLGEEVLSDNMITAVASQINSCWPELATILGFSVYAIKTIKLASSDVVEKAKMMLASWREEHSGEDQVLHLALALSKVQGRDRFSGCSRKREQVKPAKGKNEGFGMLNESVVEALTSNESGDECGASLDTEASEVDVEGPLISLDNIPIKQGVVVVQNGIACFHQCKKAHRSWKDGKLSEDEFIRRVVEPVKSMVKGVCKIGFQIIGVAVGATVSSLITVGTDLGAVGACIGFIFGGKLGSFIGEKAAPFVGRQVGKLMCKYITNGTSPFGQSGGQIQKTGLSQYFESLIEHKERVRIMDAFTHNKLATY